MVGDGGWPTLSVHCELTVVVNGVLVSSINLVPSVDGSSRCGSGDVGYVHQGRCILSCGGQVRWSKTLTAEFFGTWAMIQHLDIILDRPWSSEPPNSGATETWNTGVPPTYSSVSPRREARSINANCGRGQNFRASRSLHGHVRTQNSQTSAQRCPCPYHPTASRSRSRIPPGKTSRRHPRNRDISPYSFPRDTINPPSRGWTCDTRPHPHPRRPR